MSRFALDYVVMVFVASLGVIQIAASVARLRGLLLVPSYWVARLLGFGLAAAAIVWFFASGERNINDYEGGLDANVQALYFFLSAAAAYLTTLLVSSLVNSNLGDAEGRPAEGMEALKETTYVRALAANLRAWRREWRRRMKSYFSG